MLFLLSHPNLFGNSLLLLLCLSLGACAVQTDSNRFDCRGADWAVLGEQDANRGLLPSQLLRHQQRCVNEGVTPNRHAYLAGWRRQLLEIQ